MVVRQIAVEDIHLPELDVVCLHLILAFPGDSERTIGKIYPGNAARSVFCIPKRVFSRAATHIKYAFPLVVFRRYAETLETPAHLFIGATVKRPGIFRVHPDYGFLNFLNLGG